VWSRTWARKVSIRRKQRCPTDTIIRPSPHVFQGGRGSQCE
jgi:hypothetical protein